MFTASGTGAVTRTLDAKISETISAKDFGAVGDGTNDDTEEIQAAINALSSNQTLLFEGNFRITNSLTITNKTRVRLTGNGRIFFDGAPSGAYIFLLVGTIDSLEIDSLTLVGDNNSSYTQGAIGCNSGQTISNTRFHDLQISNTNVGISHNADLSGSWTNGWCYNNYLTNISGIVSGSGYGIQAARAYNLHIYGNTINNASRHSIYVGRGHNLACIIENNTILNHRKDVADASPRGAIDVGRTSGVIISNNTFRDCYDGMIYAGSDTGTSDNNYDILICGNKFGTPKNVVPAIWLGEQLTPTTARMYGIDILDNTFEQDCSLTTGVVINLLNGNGITVKNNRLRAYNVAAALPIFVLIGDSSFISADADISEITVTDNVCLSDKGSVVSGSRILYISDQLCTGTSVYTAKNNYGKDWATEYAFEVSPPTNLNSKLKFTTTITYTWSVPANTNGSGAFSVQGCKPTSSVTVRANSGTMVAPFLAISGYAATTVNTVEVYAVNPDNALTSTQTNMVHRIFVEDF